MTRQLTVCCALLLAPYAASASHFEDCRFDARVVHAELVKSNRARVFDLMIEVLAAQSDETRAGSDIDCSGYVGQTLGVQVQVPKVHGQPVSDDRIALRRSILDGGSDSCTTIDSVVYRSNSSSTAQSP